MKITFFSTLIIASFTCTSQLNLNTIKEKTKSSVESTKKVPLTNDEIVSGLKDALNVGIDNAGVKASALDGFNKNELIRIPFPKEAKKMEDKLRMVGMGAKVDSFELALNRAAEIAAKKAAPIFIEAIKSMNVRDGMNILKGEDDAATKYLQKSTKDSLYDTFKPIVKAALKQVKVTQYWNPLASRYNKIPLTTKVNPDLEDYTTQKAMEGLFTLLAQEEKKIRDQPAARVTDLLKRVFS